MSAPQPSAEPLNRTQIADYENNGYLVLERVFSAAECAALSDAAATATRGHFANVLNLHATSDAYRRLVVDPRILHVIDRLQSARMVPIGSIFFFCKPGNDLEQGSVWHQDNYAAKAPYGSYLTAAVALDDADPDNGSLVVFPRTHWLGELASKPSKNFEFSADGKVVAAYPIGNAVEVPEGYSQVQLSYPKGSLLLLHAHLVHGAPRNESPSRWRRKVYLHYIKDGDPFWPGWNARRQLVDRP